MLGPLRWSMPKITISHAKLSEIYKQNEWHRFSGYIYLSLYDMFDDQPSTAVCKFLYIQTSAIEGVNLAIGSTWLPLLVGLVATCTAQGTNRLSDQCVCVCACVCVRVYIHTVVRTNSRKSVVLLGCEKLQGAISYFLVTRSSQMNAEAANDVDPKY